MGKKRVEVNMLDWNATCFQDLSSGNGFLITDPPTFDWEGTKTNSMFGPQSPIYGTSITDDQEVSSRFRCRCGEFTGKAFRGETCPKCGGIVEFQDVKPEMTGWIPVENGAKLINPLYYRMLSSAIGEDEFRDIVTCQKTVNRDGIRSDLTEEDLKEIDPSTPFYGIGLEEFRSRYYEILDWAQKKKPGKKQTIDLLKHDACKVFTSYIPVYTPLLRQSSVSDDSFYYTGIDKQVNTLCNLSRNLASCSDIDKDLILNRMQTRVNKMWDINFSELDGKDGFIRDQISGGSLRSNWARVNLSNCGDVLVCFYYQTILGDKMVAMGNIQRYGNQGRRQRQSTQRSISRKMRYGFIDYRQLRSFGIENKVS